jgi:hypothetical protein
LADTSLDDVAKVDLLHDGRVDVLGFKGMLEGDGSKLGRRQGLERAVDGANGGPGGGDDDNFVRLCGVSTGRGRGWRTYHGACKKGGGETG